RHVGHRVAELVDQTGVPPAVQLVRLACDSHPNVVPAAVIVIRRMQRLMYVADKVNDPFESLATHRLCQLLIADDARKLIYLCHDAVVIFAVAGSIIMDTIEWNIDEVPRRGLRTLEAYLIGPGGNFDEL